MSGFLECDTPRPLSWFSASLSGQPLVVPSPLSERGGKRRMENGERGVGLKGRVGGEKIFFYFKYFLYICNLY